MSAQGAVEAALIGALKAHAALGGAINGVRRQDAGRASAPYLRIEDSIAADWGTKDARGRELRIAVSVIDRGESAARLHGLMALAEEAIEAMPRDLPGWRIASIVFVRGRVTRDTARDWLGTIEYRVRALAR